MKSYIPARYKLVVAHNVADLEKGAALLTEMGYVPVGGIAIGMASTGMTFAQAFEIPYKDRSAVMD